MIMALTILFGAIAGAIGFRLGNSVGKIRGDLYATFFLQTTLKNLSKETELEVRQVMTRLINNGKLYEMYIEFVKEQKERK